MLTALWIALLLAASGGQCPPAWNYENQSAWGGLSESGKSQSPIVVRRMSAKPLPALHALN
jgi:hypothetical protein